MKNKTLQINVYDELKIIDIVFTESKQGFVMFLFLNNDKEVFIKKEVESASHRIRPPNNKLISYDANYKCCSLYRCHYDCSL